MTPTIASVLARCPRWLSAFVCEQVCVRCACERGGKRGRVPVRVRVRLCVCVCVCVLACARAVCVAGHVIRAQKVLTL